MPLTTAFPQLLHTFLHDWLIVQRNTSRHTVLAYRDTWRLFLRFVAQRHQRPGARLQRGPLTATEVLAFLDHLAQMRQVTSATRNCRLAALRRFFAFVVDRAPLAATQCAAVLRLPTKRSPRREVSYLDTAAVAALLAQPERSTLEGQRDHALLACLYNTGARLQAALDLCPQARHPTHMVMIKMLIFTGLRNSELARIRPQDVDLDQCHIRVVQGKGSRDRTVLFPTSFRGELLQYMQGAQVRRAVHLFESNRLRPYSTRRIRQIIHAYALAAGIQKRVYPHLFRHQIITFLTKKGLISPKLQLLSGHAEEKSLAMYRDLALADVAAEYEEAMRCFPVR